VVHRSVDEARKYWKPTFVTLALLSTVIHWISFQTALVDTKQQSTTSRTYLWMKQAQEQRSTGNSTLIATEDIYAGLFDHPATSGPAWDVVLSGISICLWATIRAVDPIDMVRSTVWPWESFSRRQEPVERSDDPPTSPQTKRTRGKGKKATSVSDEAPAGAPDTLRRKGRRRAKDQQSDSEEAFVPSESTADEVARIPTDGEHPAGTFQDAEASALAWLYFLIGGVGAAGAAVYGADVRAK
jgi:hypothetical protein